MSESSSHDSQSITSEIAALRRMCEETASREERTKLIESFARHLFVEPEHQVVYESVRTLFSRGPVTSSRLIVHLTNRGFPDIEMEKYFPPETPAQ